jgi:pimeloyl-ACP methyl ester carboxylesterase
MIWAAALAGIAALPALREARRAARDDTLRRTAPGKFADLPQGRTHYQWHGPVDGPVMVCVHGLTTPSFVWDNILPLLIAKGFRVLTYDHFGRGYSDAPRGLQSDRFFISHLNTLLADQGVTGPFTLVGYSMGGAIATCYAKAHRDRIAQLILIAPAGMGHELGMVARITTGLPVIGDWLFHMMFPGGYVKGTKATRLPDGRIDDVINQQLQQITRRGFVRAVLSSLRGVLRNPLETEHRALSGLPVTAIWGDADAVIPITAKDVLSRWNPDVTHHVVPDATHELTFTTPNQVAETIHPPA